MTDFWKCPYCDYTKDKSIRIWGEMAADHLCDKHPLTQGIGANEKPRRKYDSTLARMAGNIAAGMVGHLPPRGTADRVAALKDIRGIAVRLAIDIVADLKRMEELS